MKKIMGWLAVVMLLAASAVWAGGDQNCGDKASGPAGSTGQGDVSQNRAAAD